MTSFHLKDSTINYRWLLTSRQRTRRDKTDARRMQASSLWEGVRLPPQTPTKALWGPARGTDHFSLKTVFSCQGCPSRSRHLCRGQPHRWKDTPPSTTRHQLPSFPIMSQNQAAFESFISKGFLDISGFFFNDEIIRSVKKLRCCGWYRHKVTDSAKNTATPALLRGCGGLARWGLPSVLSPGFLPATPKTRAFYYPNRPSYLQPHKHRCYNLQPGNVSPVSHFQKGTKNQAASSEEPRRRIFSTKNWHNTLTLCACHMNPLRALIPGAL